MTRDVSNERQTKRQKKTDKLARQREVEELKNLLGRPEFRRFVWRLLSQCGIYDAVFTGNSTTFFMEGRRDIGLFLVNELSEADVYAYAKLQVEAINAERKAEYDEEDAQRRDQQNEEG